MTPVELARLRELHEQATPAPWVDNLDSIIGCTGNPIIPYAEYPVSSMMDEDRTVLVEARNALPALLAEIERLQTRERILADRLARVNYIAPITYQLALSNVKEKDQ